MKIYIQNMVSQRCKLIVKYELEKLGLNFTSIELGEVNLLNDIKETESNLLARALHIYGLELLKGKDAIIIEKVKNIIVEMIHYSDTIPKVNISVYLSEKMNLDYHLLSNLFSKTKGITIEHFIMLHKIVRVKELIMYDELNLTQISILMHYSSVAHLSNQFKKITGLTPSFFKNFSKKNRINLEDI